MKKQRTKDNSKKKEKEKTNNKVKKIKILNGFLLLSIWKMIF